MCKSNEDLPMLLKTLLMKKERKKITTIKWVCGQNCGQWANENRPYSPGLFNSLVFHLLVALPIHSPLRNTSLLPA